MKCLAILVAFAVNVLVTASSQAQWAPCSSGLAAAFSNAYSQTTTTTTTTFSDDGGGYQPYFGGGYSSGGFSSLPWYGGSQFFAPPARTLPIWWPNFYGWGNRGYYGYGGSFNFVPRSTFGGYAYGGFNRGFTRGFGSPLVVQSGRFNRIGPGGLNRFGPNATIVQSGRRNRIR